MPTDFSTIDLATLNAAQGVMVAALRDRCCQWEQDSADLATDGNLANAVMFKHWAFAADLLSTTISAEFTNLFSKALNARFWRSDPHHSPLSCRSDAGCGCFGGGSSAGDGRTGCRMNAFEH
jgi:hypothetical protein